MQGIFSKECVCLQIFSYKVFLKVLPGMPSGCKKDWIQIRTDGFVGPDLGPNCLQSLRADCTGRPSVKKQFEWNLEIIDILMSVNYAL